MQNKQAIHKNVTKPLLLALAIFCCLFSATAVAQQTIFNVPSADVTPKKRLFLQHESQFRPWNPERFWLGTHYLAYGIGYNTDLDATLYNVRAPAAGSQVLALGFKTALPLWPRKIKERELKLTVGEMVPISLGKGGVGNWSYVHFSGRLPKVKTRLTAGFSTGTRQIFGRPATGFIGAYEQPITKNFILIGDWYSGTHSNGLFIPGFSYAFPRNVTLYCGYQIPNNRRCGRSGFVIELAKIL